ncbi:hypothetical protein Tco_1034450 [Tanacetum coccineum]
MNDFGLWQVRMKDMLEHLEELPAATIVAYDNVIRKMAYSALILCLGDRNLYTFNMHPGKSQSGHIDEFHKLVGDLAAIDTAISDEDQALLLLTSLPSSYDNFVETLLYGRDILKLEDVLTTLNSREFRRRRKQKGRRSRLRCYICQFEKNLKKDYPWYNHKKSQDFVRNEDQRDYLSDFEEYDGGNVLLGDGTECRVRETWNGLVEETNVTLLAKVHCFLIQFGLSKFFWAENTTMSTYLVNRSLSSAIGFKTLVDMLEFFGWLASYMQWMLELVVLNRNMGFNKSEEYKKTFIGSGVGTGSVQVLQGVEFEVESQEDHAFEVEPHGNIDHVVGFQEVQTQNLIDYHPTLAAVEKINAHESLIFNDTCTCEVISKWNVGLKEDIDARSNVYVLSNGKEGSDDSNDYYWEYTPIMFLHLFLYIDVMVFSCGCKAEIWVTKGLLDEAKGDILGMKIFRIQSGNTLRVSQSRVYNGKLVQTLSEGYSIMSLEGSLSGDYDVKKNDKWSYICGWKPGVSIGLHET